MMLFEEIVDNVMNENKCDVILPIGISGSGKSTWIKKLKNNGYNIISPDDIRREICGNISDQSKNTEVFALANERLKDCLLNGEKVIFDATNINTRLRRNLIDFIKSINPNAKIGYKLFDSDVDTSNERIQNDIKNGIDRANVPYEVLNRQFNSYQDTLKNIDDENLIQLF